MVKDVGKPTWDKARRRWLVRWTEVAEDGAARRRADSRSKTREEAEDLRRTLRGKPSKSSKQAPAAPAPASQDEGAWSAELAWLREELHGALVRGDTERVELVAKTARAIATMATASTAIRDLRKLKEGLVELERWKTSLVSAGTHGTRVDAGNTGRESPLRDLRPEDAMH